MEWGYVQTAAWALSLRSPWSWGVGSTGVTSLHGSLGDQDGGAGPGVEYS